MRENQRRTALYWLYGETDELLYVGVAFDPEARWRQHASDKPWWPLVKRQELAWHESRQAAESAERETILAEAPPYNTAGSLGTSKLQLHFPAGGKMHVGEARIRWADLLDGSQFRREHTEITRRGKPAGYLVPPDWYASAAEALSEVKALRREVADLRNAQPDA